MATDRPYKRKTVAQRGGGGGGESGDEVGGVLAKKMEKEEMRRRKDEEEFFVLFLFLGVWEEGGEGVGGGIAQLVVCWVRCPAWCSVVGSILLWGEFFR